MGDIQMTTSFLELAEETCRSREGYLHLSSLIHQVMEVSATFAHAEDEADFLNVMHHRVRSKATLGLAIKTTLEKSFNFILSKFSFPKIYPTSAI
jgi:hypothetical protein